MSHYAYSYREHECADFRKFWMGTQPYKQDGCTSFVQVDCRNPNKCTKASIAKAKKDERIAYAKGYTVSYIDCGIVGWEVHRKVRKVVEEWRPTGRISCYGCAEQKCERHIREVEEVKRYKSKPTKILKGGTLYETHHYVFSYDGRCYDPYEHGGFGGKFDEWNAY